MDRNGTLSTLRLTLACGSYDRTIPLQDGAVGVDGVDLNFVAMRPGDLFRRQARHAEFDIAEFSLSTYCMLHDRGDERMIAIPVFPSRKFRHSHVFVNDPSITEPADLIGKRVGAHEYQNTASAWIRGILGEEYGVRADQVQWYLGGINTPKSEGDRIPLKFGPNMDVTRIPRDRYLSEMLVANEISAIISAERPDSFVDEDTTVRRLFPDFQRVEREYFERTGIFPIMHTVVIRRDVYERNPWIARQLYDAFDAAKAMGRERLRYTGALYTSLPWLEQHLEDLDALSDGGDFFRYGLEANRSVLEKFVRYSAEQGLIDEIPEIEDLFAAETQQT